MTFANNLVGCNFNDTTNPDKMSESEDPKTYHFDKSAFRKHQYHDRIFVDFWVSSHYHYAVNRQKFRYFDALKNFLNDNQTIIIYLTTNPLVARFQYTDQNIVVNIDSFINFCSNIGDSKKNKERAKAFFGQHISLSNLNFTEQEKKDFIEANLSEKDLLTKIRTFSPESQKKVLDAIFKLESTNESSNSLISSESFISIFTKFITDNKIQESILEAIPQIQLTSLKEIKEFVKKNLDKNETFFQNWIDENKGQFRKQRCLMFGIEYIDPKREGELNRKRFDILATQNRERHVLIELKSPTAELFEIDETANKNKGAATSYKLSKELSRAIPQILNYKKLYAQMNTETVKQLGITQRKEISECIIVIGQRVEDDLWRENYKSLCDHISIKILTYTDLIEKMENTIHNLEQNL